MRKLIEYLISNLTGIYKISLFLISIFLIVHLFPRQVGFQYEYQQARPWMHEDLFAPFDFAILKTEKELEKEKEELLSDFKHFYSIDHNVYNEQQKKLQNKFEKEWQEAYGNYDEAIKKKNSTLVFDILNHIFYEKGIILIDDTLADKGPEYEIILRDGQVAEVKELSDFYSITEAYEYVNETLEEAQEEKDHIDAEFLRPLLESVLTHNIFYDKQLNEKALKEKLESISPTRGMIRQGEKIISKGELVTSDKSQVLKSFEAEYNRQIGDLSVNYIVYAGQFILVSISIVVLSLFLKTFRKDIYADNRKILLILVSILFMVLLTSLMVKHNIDLLYLVPVCIIPIVMRSFFDNRLALYVHIITIILIGFMVPKSFQFVFLQFIAGIIAILSMVTLRRRSQLFYTAGLIFLTYSAVFTGLSLAQTGIFAEIEWMNYMYFAGSAALTLFAYPIIFMMEKVFGMSTDFSLLELSDTNNKLLRDLSMKAPGTFQHSLQVANLSEEAVIKIGGNPLLVRTGALYHDIGKMDSPMYFTENQSSGINPHDELTYEDSARIITDHVIKGVEKARKHNLPEYIIDFIRTHHGTTMAKYFYSMASKERNPAEIDRKKFTYPGPKPFNIETAVLMMADSVEAASKSLSKPDEDSINKLVDKIIDSQVEENQFDNANITFKDITTVKKIFKQKLNNIFHIRIAYPSDN